MSKLEYMHFSCPGHIRSISASYTSFTSFLKRLEQRKTASVELEKILLESFKLERSILSWIEPTEVEDLNMNQLTTSFRLQMVLSNLNNLSNLNLSNLNFSNLTIF